MQSGKQREDGCARQDTVRLELDDGCEAHAAWLPGLVSSLPPCGSLARCGTAAIRPRLTALHFGRAASRCPATHFGFMKKGKMEVRMKDSDKWMLFEEGDAYFVPPGHLPRFPEDTGAPVFGALPLPSFVVFPQPNARLTCSVRLASCGAPQSS